MIGFFAGVFLGAFLGMIVLGLCVAARENDQDIYQTEIKRRVNES